MKKNMKSKSKNTTIKLNKGGEKLLGHIFPEGTVPIKSLKLINALISGSKGIQQMYELNLQRMTAPQIAQFIEVIGKENLFPKEDVKKDLEENRTLYLSTNYTKFRFVAEFKNILSLAKAGYRP